MEVEGQGYPSLIYAKEFVGVYAIFSDRRWSPRAYQYTHTKVGIIFGPRNSVDVLFVA